MSKHIEIEQKFFCSTDENLENLFLDKGFTLCHQTTEQDEYFTDLNSLSIRNRTCLRLRTADQKHLELTFKGKSLVCSSFYSKTESNVALNILEHEEVVSLLFSLGYYPYCVVSKNRKTYTKSSGTLTYNIMLDILPEIGSFIEFELLSPPVKTPQILEDKFKEFLNLFSELPLQPADLPYRDFVARYLFQKICPSQKIKALILKIDENTLTFSRAEALYQILKIIKEKGIPLYALGSVSELIPPDIFDEMISIEGYQTWLKNQHLLESEVTLLSDENTPNLISKILILINHL